VSAATRQAPRHRAHENARWARARPRAARFALTVIAVSMLAAACTASPHSVASNSGAARPARPHHRATAATSSARTPAAASSCDPTASLRPSGPPRVTSGSFMARIRARGYLIAGVDPTRYHFSYVNPLNGQFQGFEIDLLHAIAAAIFGNPDKIRFKPLQDAQRIPALRTGAVDIVAQDFVISCARLNLIDFSTPYLDSGQEVLVESDSPFKHVTSLGQLAGKKVCAVTGSLSLAHIAAATPHPIPVAAPYWTDCMVLLQQGDVAAVSTVSTVLLGLADQDPYARIVSPPLDFEPEGLGISQQHPDFVRFVNAVLARMRSDGQWAASYARWVGTPVPTLPLAHYRG
jgi:polar amino acid transport system substrate-binding protein